MPVFLKKLKRDLQSGKNLKGNYTPPNYISRDVKDYTKLRIEDFDQVARPGIKALDFQGIVTSEHTSPQSEPNYKVTIQFHDIVFNDTPQSRVDIKIPIDDKNSIFKYIRKPSIDKNPVMLRCQCQDFRHRFEHEIAAEDGLIGRPRKYTRKTPPWPVGYPYANASDKLGYCKHIHSLLFYLKGKGFITE
jgi:hypothetical protein